MLEKRRQRLPLLSQTLLWLALMGLFLPSVLAEDTLSYRDRGNRREGVLPKPVSGYDLELVGAMVETRSSQGSELPAELAMLFFLERAENVYLTVRERHPREFYWLDDVRPTAPWQAKRSNLFAWPTADVLRPLRLTPADLVALARLGRDTPSHEERVAPVFLGRVLGTAEVSAYRFTFKANGPARLRFDVFASGAEVAIAAGRERRHSADQPFDLRWEAGTRPEGTYRLRLKGYFLTDNAPIEKVVEFFHTPSWAR